MHDLRRTLGAILWRHQNGAKWRAIPADLGPWWRAAQVFIRWAQLGGWERLLALVQKQGVALGLTFLDGTNVRAHQKAAGAAKGGSAAERDHREALGAFSWRLWYRSLRDRRRSGSRGGIPDCAWAGARTAARRAAHGPAAGRTEVSGRRPRLLQPRLPPACLGRGRTARHPHLAQRGGGRLPRLDLQRPQRGRAAVGGAEGVAGQRHPLREDGLELHRRPLSRRRPRLAQVTTGPRKTSG